jgi:ankyrin repeat protein
MQLVHGQTCTGEGPTSGYEAIHYAAAAEEPELLRLLLDKTEFPPKTITEAFRLAAQNGATDCLQILHAAHQEITVLECNRNCCVDWTGYVNITRYKDTYVEQHRLWEDHECFKATCLHSAVHAGWYDTVKFLLSIGASLEARTGVGTTPLKLAVHMYDLKMMEILLHSGANPNDQGIHQNMGILPSVALKGTPEMLQLLVKYGIDISTQDRSGRNALYYSFRREDTTMTEALIELGLDPMSLDDDRTVPLQMALSDHKINDETVMLKYLPELDTVRSITLGSLLNTACFFETESVVKELLKRAPPLQMVAYINMKSPLGTPLYAVAAAGNTLLTDLLLNNGAKINLVGGFMGPPLFAACKFGRIDTIKLLLGKGAKLNYEGPDGISNSAIDAARSHPNAQLVLQRFVDRGVESLDQPLPIQVANITRLDEIFDIIEAREQGEKKEAEIVDIMKELKDELEAQLQKFLEDDQDYFSLPLTKEENSVELIVKRSKDRKTLEAIIEEDESDSGSADGSKIETANDESLQEVSEKDPSKDIHAESLPENEQDKKVYSDRLYNTVEKILSDTKTMVEIMLGSDVEYTFIAGSEKMPPADHSLVESIWDINQIATSYQKASGSSGNQPGADSSFDSSKTETPAKPPLEEASTSMSLKLSSPPSQSVLTDHEISNKKRATLRRMVFDYLLKRQSQ